MNNDIELIAKNFVEEMLGFVQREDVGIAGARLLYEDDTIQHAGVVIGFGGIAGHTFIVVHEQEILTLCVLYAEIVDRGVVELSLPADNVHVRELLLDLLVVIPGLQCCHSGLHDEQALRI